MEFNSFLGPLTTATAAGVPPMGSVFNAVPSADYLLGRTAPLILPAARSKPARKPVAYDHAMPYVTARLCGCGA